MDSEYSIGLIGAGRLAKSLLINLVDGYRFSWVLARNEMRREEIIDLIETHSQKPKLISSLAEADIPDIFMLAVSDKNIEKVSLQISDAFNKSLSGRHVAHFSGINTIEILKACSSHGAIVHKIHPYQTFYYPEQGIFQGIFWGVQNVSKSPEITNYIKLLKGRIVDFGISDDLVHVRYHASAVIASNFMNTLIAYSRELISSLNLDPEIMEPIISQTIKNAFQGNEFPLTGPIVRGDTETVAKHLESLKSSAAVLDFYASMSLLTASLCFGKKSISEAKYNEIRKIILNYRK